MARPGAWRAISNQSDFARADAVSIANASGQEDFSEQVSQSLSDASFEVQEIEDVEPLAMRKAHHEIDPDLEELSEVVLATGRPEFDAFYPFPFDDA